jgi:hypothetical protein
MNAHVDLGPLMEPVALHLLGEPNRQLSSKTEWRYGSRGSFCIDLKKGTFYDNEATKGGGVLDLIERETGKTGADRMISQAERRQDLRLSRRKRRSPISGLPPRSERLPPAPARSWQQMGLVRQRRSPSPVPPAGTGLGDRARQAGFYC